MAEDSAPIVVPALPETAVLADGSEVATPEVGLDHPAVVALEEKAVHIAIATEAKATDLATATEAKAVDLAAATEVKAGDVAATAATKASELALVTASTATALANAQQGDAIALAVKMALREQHVDHVLEEHGAHLTRINGSLGDVARELATQNATLGRIEGSSATAEQVDAALKARRLSRRTVAFSVVGVVFPAAGLILGYLGATGHL